MKIIITAGGTRERIDSVRAITNEATGRLGSLIAEEFLRRLVDREHQIYYVCGIGSAVPKIRDENLHIIPIEGTDQLLSEIKRLLTTQRIHAVIHSMAVSDYRVSSITTFEQAARSMYRTFQEGLTKKSYEEWQKAMLTAVSDQALKGHKISSNLDHPLMLLEKTPKIISKIKELSPETQLIGFKLLSGVPREELIETAYKLLKKNRCDYVLANDTGEIGEDRHTGYLLDKSGQYETFTSKAEIARGIADRILIPILPSTEEPA